MATFGETDITAHPLTIFYQCDINDREDILLLDRVFHRVLIIDGLDDASLIGGGIDPPDRMFTLTDDGHMQVTVDIAPVQKLARHIMDFAADFGGVRYGDLNELDRFRSGGFIFFRPMVRMGGSWADEDDEQMCPIGSLREVHQYGDQFKFDITHCAIGHLVSTLLNKTARYGRCEECQSAFVKRHQHPNQRFCTHRCAARMGMRRRRSQAREE